MRKAFDSFYRPDHEQTDRMWREGLFALDASFLLNLYRYSEQTRVDVLATLAKLKKQLWLPHQAGLEFHRNRPAVMHDHARKFTTMRTEFESARKRVESLYRDPSQDATDAGSLQQAWERLDSYLEEHERRSIQPTMSTDDDPVLAAVTDLLDGRVGEPFEYERLKGIYAAGADRYTNRQPPGFEDEPKPEPDRYGDLVIWHQMIEQAKASGKPIIFVTADEKRDWWWISEGRTLGPLPALLDEMRNLSGQGFWAFKPDQFMSLAGPFVDRATSAEAIQELRDIRPPAESSRPTATRLASDVASLLRSIEHRRQQLRRGMVEAEERLDTAANSEERAAAEQRLADLRRRWRRTEVEEEALRSYAEVADHSPRMTLGERYEVADRTFATGLPGTGKSSEIFRRLIEAIGQASYASDDDVDPDEQSEREP